MTGPRTVSPRLGDLLRESRELLPRSLLDGPGWETILSCADRMPFSTAYNSFGFEVRLDEPAPHGDLAVSVRPNTATAECFIEAGKAPGAAPEAVALAGLLRECGRPESFLSRFVAGPILEYDLTDPASDPSSPPGVYLLSSHPEDETLPSFHRNPGVLVASLAAAVGREEDAAERRAVERVFEALPPQGHVRHAGMFPRRTPRVLRLVVTKVEDLPGWLNHLGWPGSSPTLTTVLEAIRPLSTPNLIGLDIDGDGLRPRLGLELKPQGEGQTWGPLLAWLVETGRCLPDKAAGLLSLPGHERFFDLRNVLLLELRISHVKLTLDGTRVACQGLSAPGSAAGGAWPRGLRRRQPGRPGPSRSIAIGSKGVVLCGVDMHGSRGDNERASRMGKRPNQGVLLMGNAV